MDTRQGSVIWDLLSPAALELEQAYQQLDQVINWFFTNEDIPSDLLEAKCADVGVYRKAAVAASGNVIFTGTPGTVIPAGTRLSTTGDTPIYFDITADTTIPSSGIVQVPVQAELPGTIGNVASGSITELVDLIDGVTAVVNNDGFSNGMDEESDELLYQRYLERISTPSSSGNAADYIRWAKEIPGIGYARVFRCWNGPGTVRVVLFTYDKKSPSPQLIDQVRQNIEAKKPDLADVTVDGASELSIDIDVKLTLINNANVQAVMGDVAKNIGDYLNSIAFTENLVRYNKIGEAILNSISVLDYEDLRVNNGTSNILLADDQIPVLGKVNLI